MIVKERLLVEGGATNQILSQFDGPVTFNGDVRLSKPGKKLTVKGTTNLDGAINLTGATKVSGNLEVTGTTEFNNTVDVDNNFAVRSGTTDKFTVASSTGDTVVAGDLQVDGLLKATGNVALGDTSLDQISTFGSFINNLIPKDDDTRDLGSSTKRWKEVYATSFIGGGSGLTNLVLDKLTVSGNTIVQADANGIDVKKSDGAKGTVIGNLDGNASKVTISTESTDETCGIVFNDGSLGDDKTLHINSGLSYNSSNKQVTIGGDIVGQKFFYLGTLTESNSGDILTTGGDDAEASLKITNNEGDKSKLSIAGRKRSGSNITSVSLDNNDYVNICHFTISGTNNTPEFTCDGDVVAFALSDKNLKDNIKPLQNALDMINSLSGNTFTWKPDVGTKSETDDIGVIAQEVEALGLPGINTTRDDGTKAVKYEKLVPILIEAVKELSAKVTALENK